MDKEKSRGSRLPLLPELFLSFAKIGLFTFGGGYAMISLIEETCVEKKQWITHDEMMDLIVIAESTPGPIAINCATYVGSKKAGVPGALIATLGMALPSFLVIYLLSLFLEGALEIPLVANAFRGIKVAVAILIIRAAVTMIRKMPVKRLSVIILCASALAMLLISLFSWRFSSIWLLLLAALLSLSVWLVRERGFRDGGKEGEPK